MRGEHLYATVNVPFLTAMSAGLQDRHMLVGTPLLVQTEISQQPSGGLL